MQGPLAEAYVQQRKFQRLLETIFLAAHTPQVQVDITVLRGQAHLELGDLDAAERSFVEALGLKRDHAPALLGRALVMLRRNRLDAAEQLIDDAVKHAPEDAEVWYLRGELRRIPGERADAIDAYGEALSRAPLHAPAEPRQRVHQRREGLEQRLVLAQPRQAQADRELHHRGLARRLADIARREAARGLGHQRLAPRALRITKRWRTRCEVRVGDRGSLSTN